MIVKSVYVQLFIRVTFVFKPSKKSNNGTDVNAGQIPQILFRVIALDTPPSRQHCNVEAVHSISRNFCKVVSPVKAIKIILFDSLIKLSIIYSFIRLRIALPLCSI